MLRGGGGAVLALFVCFHGQPMSPVPCWWGTSAEDSAASSFAGGEDILLSWGEECREDRAVALLRVTFPHDGLQPQAVFSEAGGLLPLT